MIARTFLGIAHVVAAHVMAQWAYISAIRAYIKRDPVETDYILGLLKYYLKGKLLYFTV
jgi:hypothetical protein